MTPRPAPDRMGLLLLLGGALSFATIALGVGMVYVPAGVITAGILGFVFVVILTLGRSGE